MTSVNSEKSNLIVDRRVEHIFKTLVDQTIRKQRCEERRLAEQRITKYALEARKSCIFDARNYRVARRLLFLRRILAFDTQI